MFINVRVLVIAMLVTSLTIFVCAQMSPVARHPKVTQSVAQFVKRQNHGGHNGGNSRSASSSSSSSDSSSADPTSLSSSPPTSISDPRSSSSDSASSTTDPPTTNGSPTTSSVDPTTTQQTPSPTSDTLTPTITSGAGSSTTSSAPTTSSAIVSSSSHGHTSSNTASSVFSSSSSIPVTSSQMTSPTASSSTATAPPNNNSSSSTNTGAIVGGVVGGVAALAIIGGLLWFCKVRRRKQAENDMPFYANDMVASDFADHDKGSPSQQHTVRNFVPPAAVMEDDLHSDMHSQPSQGYYDAGYGGAPYMTQPAFDDYNYGSNTETSSTTAPHSEYLANLMAQRRGDNYAYPTPEGSDMGTEREQIPYSPAGYGDGNSFKPDTQDHEEAAPYYGKPDSRE